MRLWARDAMNSIKSGLFRDPKESAPNATEKSADLVDEREDNGVLMQAIEEEVDEVTRIPARLSVIAFIFSFV